MKPRLALRRMLDGFNVSRDGLLVGLVVGRDVYSLPELRPLAYLREPVTAPSSLHVLRQLFGGAQ